MKTWIEMLGESSKDCVVDERYISKALGEDRYKVLMACDTNKQAIAVFQAWEKELAAV